MSTSAELFNASWGAFVDLKRAGQVTDEEWLKGYDMDLQFYNAYQKAADILVAFEEGAATKGQVNTAVELMQTLNKQLMLYLQERLKKGGKT
jgi:hypothetical protein